MFRIPYTITRRQPGSYVQGNWVQGAQETVPITANVQPATASDYDTLQPLAEGRRIERAIRIYTSARLVAAGEQGDGDRITFDGATFEVRAVSPWRSTPLKHYRYLAAKVLEP